jgi:hypothetical protein
MMLTQKSDAREKASLIFHQYGDSYFLSEVWTGADEYGLALPKSRAERDRNEVAKVETKRVTVALNARR